MNSGLFDSDADMVNSQRTKSPVAISADSVKILFRF
jgi:hypothetical protein